MSDIAKLITRLRDQAGDDPNGELYDQAADMLQWLADELSNYVEVEETNRDLVKRCDFWKARAEKAEAALADLQKRYADYEVQFETLPSIKEQGQ